MNFYIMINLFVGISFTIVPTTQYVWTNQNATFICAINVTNLSGTLHMPVSGKGTVTGTTSSMRDGQLIVLVLSFIVTSNNNGSSVRCYFDNGIALEFAPGKAYAYVQG